MERRAFQRWCGIVGLICIGVTFTFIPWNGYGGDATSELSQKIDRSRSFTISRIDPNPDNQSLTITFSETCSIAELKNLLKISPPTRWEFSGSLSGLSISLKGDFRPGQDYGVFLPEAFECNGRRYTQTLHRFKWPDLEPSIRFAENETVIERDSRQMIHLHVTNVEELRFDGLQIPPLLVPLAATRIAQTAPYEEIERELREIYRTIENLPEIEGTFREFLGPFVKDRQQFFPKTERNKPQIFSLPLSFRNNREKGAIEIIRVRGDQGTETPVRLFRITDLALTYKISADSLLLWVTSLKTGKPVEKASLAAFLSDGAIVSLGKTDEKGLFFMRNHEERPHLYTKENPGLTSRPLRLNEIRRIAVATATDRSFIDMRSSEIAKADWITQARFWIEEPLPKESREGRRPLLPTKAISPVGNSKGHVFTERGIYRPGETVHFKGTVRQYRDGTIRAPAQGTVTFTILNSKEEEVYRKEMGLSEFGTASGTFETKPYFPLGTYVLKMAFEDTMVEASFEVQEFRPPRHFVQILSRRESKKDETFVNLEQKIDLLRCQISGKYYAGGPVKHGRVRWKVSYAGTQFKEKAYPEYVFGNAFEGKSDLIESGESILDEKGELTVSFPISKEVVSGIYGVEVVATVLDFDARAATEVALFQEKPPYLVGLTVHEPRVRAGEAQVLKVIVIGPEGRPVENEPIGVEVLQSDYLYVRKRDERGRVYWESKEVYRPQLKTTLELEKGWALFDFDFITGGKYLLKFTYQAKDGRPYFASTFYEVEGYFYGYEEGGPERKFERLSVSTDKKEYGPGDTIRVFFNPRNRPASLLMTIEQKGILHYRVIDAPQGKGFVDIPVEKAFEPNVYLSFLGTLSRSDFPLQSGQFDEGAPGFLFGVANVDIRREPKKIQVAMNEDSPLLKAKPGDPFELKLSVQDGSGKAVEAEMALCVVDESVLAMTGFRTPSLETLLRFTLPLSVFTADLRSELLRQTPFGFVRNEPLTGGGGQEGGKDFSTTKLRKDFRPVAYCNMAVRTDRDGKAEIRFTLPDTMTTYRVYVVLCDRESGFASAERSLLVVKDFYLEAGQPAFFTRGDRFKFYVSAFNKTDQTGSVRFSLGADPLLSLSAGGSFPIAPFDKTLLPVEGEALRTGLSDLIFAGRFKEKEDAVGIKLPIRSGHLPWSDVVFGTIRRSATIRYTFPEGTQDILWNDLHPDDVKAILTVSSSPFLRLSKGLRYLLQYPYGCIEQTSSGILPLAGLRNLIREGWIPDMDLTETDRFLKPGIERLLSMQTDNGGFAYWPGQIHPDPWGTIYAIGALTQARLSGFEIPSERLKKALHYLTEAIGREGKTDSTFRGHALYLLALNESLPSPLFREAYRDMGNMSREGALLLLLAGRRGNFVPMRELAIQTLALLSRPQETGRRYAFHARYREPAIALMASSAILKDDAVSGRFVKDLIEGMNRQGIWTSTSDTGWALIALGDYFRGKSFGEKPVKITVSQDGRPPETGLIEARQSFSLPLDPQTFLRQPEVKIEAETDSDLLYTLSLTFPRVDYGTKGYLRGFRIHKIIENIDGTKEIRVGDVVKVKINIETDEPHRFVVLDDPLPAGLVAINSAIKTEERVGARETGGPQEDWEGWDPLEGLFKFVPSFFEIREDRVLAFRDQLWRGGYQYAYYARAVCEGDFIMSSTKIQLMYEPEIVSFTPVERVVIKGRP